MVTREAPRYPSSKVMTLDAAAIWRRSVHGAVVFTNGVFDLLHPGHVEVLDRARREAVLRMKEEARGLGARMIVNVKFQTFSIPGRKPGSLVGVEMLAYGTALLDREGRPPEGLGGPAPRGPALLGQPGRF